MTLCGLTHPRFLGPIIYPEAPDGGWGWVVAVAFFLVEIFTYGTIKIFGIFLQDLMEEFGETNSRISWIVSICVFVMTFNGPLSSVMTNRCGFQLVVMIGGLLISSGTIATSFTTSVNQMYITYGLVAGLGYCLTFLPTVTILTQYFTRRRSLVVALASTGESLSMFALAPAFSALRDLMGWRTTMAVIGSLQATIIICGALLRPIVIKPSATYDAEAGRASPNELEAFCTAENLEGPTPEESTKKKTSLGSSAFHSTDQLTRDSVSTRDSGVQSLKGSDSSPEEKKESRLEMERKPAGNCKAEKQTDKGSEEQAKKPKLLDFSILQECSFIFYSLFGLFATLGFFAPPLYVIELSVSCGVPRERATYMLSVMAVAEILGRFSIGWLLSLPWFRDKKLLALLCCVSMMTADLVGFTLAADLYGLATCCAVFGFFMGTISCTHIPMLAEDDVVGIDRMSSAAGVYVFIHSFAGLAGPPIGGVLVDLTQNYGSAFYSCAMGTALSALCLGLVKPAKKGLICRKRFSKYGKDPSEGKGDSEEKYKADQPDKRTDNLEPNQEVTASA